MSPRAPRPPWVVFSDLDGTLLDHHDYAFDAARPALEALRARGIPLVLATSKTLAELAVLREALCPGAPVVAENGGHVQVPAGYFERLAGQDASAATSDTEHAEGATYAEVRRALLALRAEGHEFVGFGDVDDAEVARWTGLSEADAGRARARQSSEPLRFLGRPEALPGFREALRARGLRLLRGGRFFHVQAPVDKADGLRYLRGRYAEAYGRTPCAVALGDGDNDLGMLEAADVAVVIPPRGPGRVPIDPRGTRCHRADAPGPTGWNAAILGLLAEEEGRDHG